MHDDSHHASRTSDQSSCIAKSDALQLNRLSLYRLSHGGTVCVFASDGHIKIAVLQRALATVRYPNMLSSTIMTTNPIIRPIVANLSNPPL